MNNNAGKVNKSNHNSKINKILNSIPEKNKNKGQNKFDQSDYFTTYTGISTNLESELTSLNTTNKLEPAYKNPTKKPLKMNTQLQNYNEQPVYAAK